MYERSHLQLYRSIRRLHKSLPPAFRFMGNKYIRDEWDRHRSVLRAALPDPPSAVASTAELEPNADKVRTTFIAEWARYHNVMAEQVNSASRWEESVPKYGVNLESSKLDAMNDQQIGQLHALKQEVLKGGKE
ncbi:hypothetical protein CcCBS67573_g00398 [Chytriomyces confervae]|uniref:Succinate dehydrogenase assembly factor 3 n=1 Tax=Chytriomyces confervae TaxID=246404 RepID=A0A507FSM8_9FUNG|nr:acetate non-utilizing protein 9 [Chytriomyces hyalinus]TPX78328.1 hypothetical protein CcCBS67573_g00398 [Chytriomyces confervae]